MSLLHNTTPAQATEGTQARPELLPAVRAIPMLPTELDEHEFPRRLFGYDRYSVTKVLHNLRDMFSNLSRAVAERDEQIRHLELELHRSREGDRLIVAALVDAQQHAQSIREEARRNAAALLKKAREHAEMLREQTEREATARAQELIASGEQERARLLAQAGEAKAFVDQTHEQLSDFLMAAAKLCEKAELPDDDGAAAEAPSVSGERP